MHDNTPVDSTNRWYYVPRHMVTRREGSLGGGLLSLPREPSDKPSAIGTPALRPPTAGHQSTVPVGAVDVIDPNGPCAPRHTIRQWPQHRGSPSPGWQRRRHQTTRPTTPFTPDLDDSPNTAKMVAPTASEPRTNNNGHRLYARIPYPALPIMVDSHLSARTVQT